MNMLWRGRKEGAAALEVLQRVGSGKVEEVRERTDLAFSCLFDS